MTDILLVYPPYTYTRKSPPLGLAYIASALEGAGYSVKILDMSAVGMDWVDFISQVKRIRPRIAGISFMTNQFKEAIKASLILKEINSEVPIIVGGPHASALPGEILSNDSIDFVVIGEGENTMRELVAHLLNGEDRCSQISGIAYRDKDTGETVLTAPREFISDLDSLPFPAWHLLAIERYSVLATGAQAAKRIVTILSSRGCPNQCIFCDSHTVFGRKFRARSAENIFAEVMYLKEKFNISQFDFADDTITIDKERMMKLCNLIIDSNLMINWMCNVRVNTVDGQMLGIMRRAGCVRVDLGVESGDTMVLAAIKKGITLERIKLAHKLAQASGIKTNSFLMVGNLREDFNSVKKTVEFVRDFVEDANVAIATPYPGTELYQVAKSNGWLRESDWSRFVTSPTYLPDYHPVMVTDKMNEDQILQAFFYVHSKLVKKKFETRYGKCFYLNPHFYSDKLFNIRDSRDFFYKLKLIWSTLAQSFI